jgi:dimethylglycine dehydrogenase
MEVVGPERTRELHPFYALDGIKAALHTPHDGHVDPAGVTLALAAGARQMSAKVIRRNRATGLTRSAGGEWIVQAQAGDIRAEIVVNTGGTYARQIGMWAGLDLPIANLLHHYLITEPVPDFQDLESELPVVRDDRQVSGYIPKEQRSGLIGIYEKAGAATDRNESTPWEAENELFEPHYDRIMPWLENAMTRMPIFAERGIRRVIHGAITHPPDGNMLLGPSGVRDFCGISGCAVARRSALPGDRARASISPNGWSRAPPTFPWPASSRAASVRASTRPTGSKRPRRTTCWGMRYPFRSATGPSAGPRTRRPRRSTRC